jgi:hypothetical protein
LDDGWFAAHSLAQDFKETKGGHAEALTLEMEPIVPLRVELKPLERIVIGEPCRSTPAPGPPS